MARMDHQSEGEAEAVVLIKAAPQVSQQHGETVCCAAIDLHGNWLRLYPVSFRHLADEQKFGRWDRIRFKWRLPKDDRRLESRRIDQQSLEVVGKLRRSERERFLGTSVKTGLLEERDAGRSLALLRAEILDFWHEEKTEAELQAETEKFRRLNAQTDMFTADPNAPYTPSPIKFKYRYSCDDGIRVGTCQDWEIEATLFRWSHEYGEAEAVRRLESEFGERYPEDGMLLAMGTHSQYPDTWLINGVVRLNDTDQLSLI